jgi:hypothetical protein
VYNKIKQRHCRLTGHVMHVEKMKNIGTTGKIQGKGDIGRQREKIQDGVCRWLGVKDNKDIFRDGHDRARRRNMIANTYRDGTG